MSKLDELEKYGTPAEEIAMLRDKIKELEKLSADLIIQATCARERGAREMAEIMTCDCEDCSGENWQREVDSKVQLWRDGRGK